MKKEFNSSQELHKHNESFDLIRLNVFDILLQTISLVGFHKKLQYCIFKLSTLIVKSCQNNYKKFYIIFFVCIIWHQNENNSHNQNWYTMVLVLENIDFSFLEGKQALKKIYYWIKSICIQWFERRRLDWIELKTSIKHQASRCTECLKSQPKFCNKFFCAKKKFCSFITKDNFVIFKG